MSSILKESFFFLYFFVPDPAPMELDTVLSTQYFFVLAGPPLLAGLLKAASHSHDTFQCSGYSSSGCFFILFHFSLPLFLCQKAFWSVSCNLTRMSPCRRLACFFCYRVVFFVNPLEAFPAPFSFWSGLVAFFAFFS